MKKELLLLHLPWQDRSEHYEGKGFPGSFFYMEKQVGKRYIAIDLSEQDMQAAR